MKVIKMRFEEISAPLYTARVKAKHLSDALTACDVINIKLTSARGEFELYTTSVKTTRVVPSNSSDIASLTAILAAGQEIHAQLSNIDQDGSAELQISPSNGDSSEENAAPLFSGRVKARNVNDSLTAGDVSAVKQARSRGVFELQTTIEKVIRIVPSNSGDINSLTNILVTGRAILARLSDVAEDGSAELQIVQFNGGQIEMGEVEIGVDERAISVLKKGSLEKTANYLWKQSVLEHGGKRYFFILAGKSADDTLKNTAKPFKSVKTSETSNNDNAEPETDDSDEESEEQESMAANRCFAVVGGERVFSLSEKDKGNDQTIFLASRIHWIYNRNFNPDLRLACGNLKFVDWTATGERATLAKYQLDKLVQNENSYLSKWDEYVNTEGDAFLELARKIGKIHFTVLEENKDKTVVVSCDDLNNEQKEALLQINELEVVEDDGAPEYLNNLELSFEDFSSSIVQNEDSDQQDGPVESYKISDFNENTGNLILKMDVVPTGRWLIYPYKGQIAQIRRRKKAREDIQSGRSANPSLGLLIEEDGQIPPAQSPPKMEPLTAFVTSKVFPTNRPTPAQREAIKIALNTPDIALIQGPPGTGKTTVIAAIIERLNEEADKRIKSSDNSSQYGQESVYNGLSGQVLLTGFQHDAVENMISRMKINGLPVLKFGKRSGQQGDGFSHIDKQLKDWCDKQIKEIKDKNPQIAKINESVKEQEFRNACIHYFNDAPSLSLAIELLEEAIRISDRKFGEDLHRRLENECSRLKKEQNAEQLEHPHLTYVRGLRITEKGFSDDGPARAMDALTKLKDELNDDEIACLVKASRWTNKNETPPFLKELKALKGRLFIRFTPAPKFQMEKVRDSVFNLLHETLDAIHRSEMTDLDRKSSALAELLLEMENNPSGIVSAIKDYCYAFAVTCQQSVNNNMKKMKGITPYSDMRLVYDYVIVDEAARVSPMDLMIPMVQGKRIILVGDHRQLPQLINEYVVTKMEEAKSSDVDNDNDNASSNNSSENDWIKKSMFEYLFTKRIPELEKRDGIIRRVMLDTQYRMHPLLGDFVSRNFYERFEPEKKLNSGLSEEYFTHQLPGTDSKCAIWIDVPRGRMTSAGTSFKRQEEANVICKKLKEWIEYDNSRTSDPDKRLKFGVISFYKAQTDLITGLLAMHNLNPETLGEDRLRIGTVDSFQGMEFDVVFLSLVRTGSKSYGFMQMSNRLNVSMSRQKKLLVVVGDAAFYDTENAKDKVPGLANFLQLCREKGKVL